MRARLLQFQNGSAPTEVMLAGNVIWVRFVTARRNLELGTATDGTIEYQIVIFYRRRYCSKTGNQRKVWGIVESISTDEGQACRQGDLCKPATVTESFVTNRANPLRQGNIAACGWICNQFRTVSYQSLAAFNDTQGT